MKESGVILLNRPLALIGGVFALVITSGEVSIPAIIGFISLFGIATRNGMLLISHYNHLQKEEGLNVYDSVIQGSLDRLLPFRFYTFEYSDCSRLPDGTFRQCPTLSCQASGQTVPDCIARHIAAL